MRSAQSLATLRCKLRGGHSRDDASQIFDQCQAKHNGDGPQLAQPEARHGLISRDQRGQTLGCDSSIDVRDQFLDDVVNARQSGEWPGGELRKLCTIVFRQMPVRRANLLFDQVEIVQQPFLGRRDAHLGFDGRADKLVPLLEDRLVFLKPVEKTVRPGMWRQHVTCGQRLGMPFQLSVLKSSALSGASWDCESVRRLLRIPSLATAPNSLYQCAKG